MIDDETRAKALAQVRGIEKASATEYEDEWAADKEATEAQTAADAGVAAGKKADADPDFDYDTPAADRQAPSAAPEPDQAMTFKETFAAHRKAGESTFEWNGKRYTTALAKSTAAPAQPGKTAASGAAAPAPSMTLTQKLGSDYAAVKQSADTMPAGTSATARSALNEDVTRRQRSYEQAVSAEKSGTSVTRLPGAPAKAPMALNLPPETSPTFNIPGKRPLSAGKERDAEPYLAETTPRRGYKS